MNAQRNQITLIEKIQQNKQKVKLTVLMHRRHQIKWNKKNILRIKCRNILKEITRSDSFNSLVTGPLNIRHW